MVEFLKRNKIAVGLAVFTLAVIYVFFPVLGKYAALHAPDSMPFFSYKYASVVWANVLGGQTAFTPHTLYWLIFNPLYAHELTYIIDTLVLTLGALYYLRGRGVSPLAAWCGALALGFSGYTFTLFCAGHRGYFHMFSCAVWAFGLIDRGFSTKKLIYFALTGLVFAWGIPYQPDVFIFVASTAALYAFWLTFKQSTSFLKTALSVWPRFLVMLIFLVMAGYNAIHSAVTDRIADRKAQMAGVSKSSGNKSNGSKDKAEPEVSPKEQWLFATNWSLPPEDMLEFIVPGVFGNESFNGEHPYWGRLGQPHKSVFQKGRMMPNYRQHTVYFGVVSFVFSLFAVLAWFKVRKLPDEDSEVKDVFRDVPFWAGIWLFCLLLAFGRYTPVYRLFYAIPYMNLIRAPVKFLHIVEIASALLCGYGVHVLLSSQSEHLKLKRMLLRLVGCVAVVLVVSALLLVLGGGTVVNYVKELGPITNADSVGNYALQNIGRSCVFLALTTGCCLLGIASKRWRAGVLITVLLLIVIDQSTVARRYMKAMDLTPYYTENAVVKAVKADSAGALPRVLLHAPPVQPGGDWFRRSLFCNDIIRLAPSPSDADKPYSEIFKVLNKEIMRLWQVFNVRHVVIPYADAIDLVEAGVANPLLIFEIGAGVVRRVSQQSQNTLALLALRSTDTKPRLFTHWHGGVAVSEHVKYLKQSELVVSDAVMSTTQDSETETSVDVLFENPLPGSYSIGVATLCAVESLLVFNQRDSDKYEILIDGQPQVAYVADGIWLAAKLEPGEHEVVLRRRKNLLPFIASVFAVFCVFVTLIASKKHYFR
ncbi:MAG: hypothetical protein R6V06_06340 [Kiritimatiellia bacterium]